MAIRAKLVFIVFIFAILPMFLLAARWSRTSIAGTTGAARVNLDARAHNLIRFIDQAFQLRVEEMTRLAESAPLRGYTRELAQTPASMPDAQLRERLGVFLLTHQRLYASLLCVNREARTLFRVDNGQDADGSPRPFFVETGFLVGDAALAPDMLMSRKTEPFAISPFEQTPDGAIIRLAIPLRVNDGGDPSGVLVARLRADELLVDAAGPRVRVVAGQNKGARDGEAELGSSAIILDQTGTVLFSAESNKLGQKFNEAWPEFAQAFASAMARGPGAVENDIWPAQGRNWMIRAAAWPVAAPGAGTMAGKAPRLTILAMENLSGYLDAVESAGFTMYLLTFALAIALTLLLYYLISRVTDSIRRVTRGARAITAGKLDHRIEVSQEDGRIMTAARRFGDWFDEATGFHTRSGDETRVLADSFNRMADRLREMIARESEQKQFESFARLSAVLTHDLKNSIFSLSLLVQNMERKFDRVEFRQDAMKTLSNSVTDLQSLVARLSDPLAQSNYRQSTDLSAIVERVLMRVGGDVGAKHAMHSLLLPGLIASVDARAIERVVENLIINAIEAMPDGGKLTVASRVENDFAMISVSDTGRGMTGEFIRDRLFRPFATTKKKGIGLGLYSCRDIIEQHNGRIEVSSQPGAGTEFRVLLPIDHTRDKKTPGSDAAAEGKSGSNSGRLSVAGAAPPPDKPVDHIADQIILSESA
ncbi:MAG: ATP-binding protein [Blastocatellia bacterium]